MAMPASLVRIRQRFSWNSAGFARHFCAALPCDGRSARIPSHAAALDPAMTSASEALRGLTVLERGWLSSNNVLLHGDGRGAVLVDAGHMRHAAQTVALVRHALRGEALSRIVNTHLHSDHCGGNAALQRAFGCRISIPPGQFAAVQAWDEVALSYAPTGQECERYAADDALLPGSSIRVGGLDWQAHAAPGHDPHSLILHCAERGVVITADALWQRGFGVVFPELDGVKAFDEVEATLELIAGFGAHWAIPGHGAPFDDVPAALARARQRLAAFRADPRRHAHHAVKALVKFHLLEVQQQSWSDLLAWFSGVTLYEAVWRRLGCPDGGLDGFAGRIVGELVAQDALALRDGVVFDA
jgi:glyoxylase-like metal-dependent hydrolase (beta-lactamase superfamily II)